jgi:hypothetical protein
VDTGKYFGKHLIEYKLDLKQTNLDPDNAMAYFIETDFKVQFNIPSLHP